ncbi:MAG: BTAD domain-containing putative transcriptional regulator [Actinomycetota bacterium]
MLGEDERPAVLAAKTRVPGCAAIPRQRLDTVLAGLWARRLALVVAPAGSGKTTLLAQFARGADCAVGWYRAEASDSSEAALAAHLERALAGAIPAPAPAASGPWNGVGDVAASLEAWEQRVLLAIDDLHVLAGTEAERAFERLIDYLPPNAAVLAATRHLPGFNLSRLRVSGHLLELGPDDLRFRSWEAEALFRDLYAAPLPPGELADLARRTEGWAAGLQMFHLATSGKSPAERRRILSSLGSRSRLVREYLARNVLDELPDELRSFLIGTCVLGRLRGPVCDELLGRQGSEAVLAELERRQIFTSAVDDTSYRYHEVLRSHLDTALFEERGEEAARAHYQRGARLLEADGALSEALYAYCRAEDWAAAARLLGRDGEQLVDDPCAWVETLPVSLVAGEAWLLVARARRHLAQGQWHQALDAYQRADATSGSATARDACRRERRLVAPWFDPSAVAPPGWTGVALAGVRRDPRAAWTRALELPGPSGQLVAGVAALLYGHPVPGRDHLVRAADDPFASPAVVAGARVAAAVALLLTPGGGAPDEVEGAAVYAERRGLPWLAALARAALALTPRPSGVDEAAAIRVACEEAGDDWGAGLSALMESLGLLARGGAPLALLDDAAGRFRRLGSSVLEAWCRSLLAVALARSGSTEARRAALDAEALARSTGVRGPQAVAHALLGAMGGERATEHAALGRTLAEECGLAAVALVHHPTGAGPEAGGPPPVELLCFGGFRVSVRGRAVELGGIRPRARAVLRLLAVSAGRSVHREHLLDAFWPDVDPHAAAHQLQVAVSTLRQVLRPDPGNGPGAYVVRDGDAYRLELPAGADVDVVGFERAVEDGRAAFRAGDPAHAAVAFHAALNRYRGDLLPEDGPAEWVVKRREQLGAAAVDAAHALAEAELALGRPSAAAGAAERGLQIDRYRDGLWRLLVAAHEAAGERAAATKARKGYDEALSELGLGPEPVTSSGRTPAP